MNTVLKHIILFLLITSASNLFAQTNQNLQLANQHFAKQEYEQANDLYSKLYSKKELYDISKYIKSLQAIEQFKQAEKILKKELKRDNENAFLYIDLGYNYKLVKDQGRAKYNFEKALKYVPSYPNRTKTVADYFLAKKEINYAIRVYENGKKQNKKEPTYYLELSHIYSQQKKLAESFNQLITLLSVSPAYLQTVQKALLINIGDEDDYGKLTTQVLKQVQKNPNEKVYAELLIWNYIQQKKFTAATIQAKALDKRFKEDGLRLFQLGEICASNNHYQSAITAYKYVITKGPDNYYYYDSKAKLLEVYKQKVTASNYTKEDILELEKLYLKTIDELGSNYRVVPVLKDYGHLQAFYLHNTDKAILNLKKAIGNKASKKKDIAEAKLTLGDVLIFTGEMWESSLLYSQVEKDFEQNPLGHLAKFKNAKLSYYRNEFKWAQSQLDVLKASTTKLIANDALELSLLIQDNTIDTTTIAMQAFATADLLAYQNKTDQALSILDSLLNKVPDHSLADDIYYKKAQIALQNREFEKAAKLLEIVCTKYKFDILADNAQFELAELNEKHLNNNVKAKELYKSIILDFPGSIYVVEARKRFRELRGDNLN